jgi:hypothetical protein
MYKINRINGVEFYVDHESDAWWMDTLEKRIYALQKELALEKLARQIDAAKTWGRWTINHGNPPRLTLAGQYAIGLDDIHGLASFGEWLIHLSEKTWVTATDLGNFVLAIGDLIRIGVIQELRLEDDE